MTRAQLLPSIMIALSVGACIVYACAGDVRKALYWGAASLLNAAVTF